jgi:Tfp pilus assembly protein PilF
MLKMGDNTGGVLVLAINAEDYPQSSTSAFGLCRAYNSAGDRLRAQESFERALQLDPNNNRAADARALIRRQLTAGGSAFARAPATSSAD